jgi:hypothetical protein
MGDPVSEPLKSADPFEEFGISPLATPEEITARLQELFADADDSEQARLRTAFDRLTRSPHERLELVLGSFIEEPEVPLPSSATRALPRAVPSPLKESLAGGVLETYWAQLKPESAEKLRGLQSSGHIPLEQDPLLGPSEKS